MTVLDQVIQMKNQGLGDEHVIKNLQEQGISPREISDALTQSQIKDTVTGQTTNMEGMEPSIMQTRGTEADQAPQAPTTQAPGLYTPSTQEITETPIPYAQEYAPEYDQEYYQPEAQGYGYEGGYAPASDTGTMIEISEQVFVEKIAEIQKQIDTLNSFKAIAETRIENIGVRLHKIEVIIDKLQAAILEKIGSYGSDLNAIKKEMIMVEDSFAKMLGSKPHHTAHPHKKYTIKKSIHKTKTKKKISKKSKKK